MDVLLTRKGSDSQESKRPKQKPPKSVLKALNADDSIDLKLLKKIAKGCLERLKERNSKGKCN